MVNNKNRASKHRLCSKCTEFLDNFKAANVQKRNVSSKNLCEADTSVQITKKQRPKRMSRTYDVITAFVLVQI